LLVSVTGARNKLTKLLAAVEKGQLVALQGHGRVIAELAQPSVSKVPRLGSYQRTVAVTKADVEEFLPRWRFAVRAEFWNWDLLLWAGVY
jgi:antitoxin (DNA-binding transcriptional repressor) of toxin-antitoxin stability system